jgi:3-hydroxybutyryl-CoA dehydratase
MDDSVPVSPGETAEFSKTLTETDVALFATISGDFDPIHVDESYARTTPFGRRIAHGLLAMAPLSTVSAMISARARDRGFTGTAVSAGYDALRFLKPVFIGDTLTARYTVVAVEHVNRRSRSKVEVFKANGELAIVGEHLMKWLPKGGDE